MKFLASLLFSVMLLMAAACSKDSPPPAPRNNASYIIDGRRVEAKASAQISTGLPGGEDYLYIYAFNNADKDESAGVIFSKPTGAPDADYKPVNLRVDKNNTADYYADNLAVTLSKTSSGYSGTFAGTRPQGSTGRSTISGGVFTNVVL